MKRRLFAGYLTTLGPVSVGKWDRFFSWGTKNKDGAELVFNEETLSQVVDNFATRQNLLAMDWDHQTAYVAENGRPAPALAFYCALALVVDGEVKKFVSRDDSVKAPDPTGFENGIYGYRSEVTPLGQELLPNYKYISPMFTDAGADEAGNPIGYDLMNVAATNTPFQDGCEITFNRGIAMADNADLMKRLGLGDDASPEETMAAMKAYLKKLDDDAALDDKDDDADDKKMADGDGDADDKKMAKPGDQGEPRDAQFDDAEAMDDAEALDDAEAMKKLAKDLSCEASPKAVYEAVRVMKLSHVPKARLAETEKRLASLESKLSKLDSEKKKAEAERFADEAIKLGRWNPKERASLVETRLENTKLAEKALAPAGTWSFMRRVTQNGTPIGKFREEEAPVETNDSEYGGDVSVKARKLAKEQKITLEKAYQLLSRESTAYAPSKRFGG